MSGSKFSSLLSGASVSSETTTFYYVSCCHIFCFTSSIYTDPGLKTQIQPFSTVSTRRPFEQGESPGDELRKFSHMNWPANKLSRGWGGGEGAPKRN